MNHDKIQEALKTLREEFKMESGEDESYEVFILGKKTAKICGISFAISEDKAEKVGDEIGEKISAFLQKTVAIEIYNKFIKKD